MPSYEEENTVLMADNDSYELIDSHTPRPTTEGPAWAQPKGRPHMLAWALALLVIVAATDLAAVFCMSRIVNTVYADVGTAELEYASPYYGLAELYSSGTVQASRIDPILNIPRVVAQVFSDRPDEPAPVGEHDVFTKAFGSLTPHEKHLKVSANTRTVAQFRTIDFGMEECELVIRLPGDGDPIESEEPVQYNPHSKFDVFRLDAPKPLDVRKLSYKTRPPGKEKVATVSPRVGQQTHVATFPCPWSTLHTFEVACAEDSESECLIDVWSSQNTTWGFYMYQHQTV